MDLGLSGKQVVVTGAGKGIGLAITRGFVDEGAHVVAGSRTATAELRELAAAGPLTSSRSTWPIRTVPTG